VTTRVDCMWSDFIHHPVCIFRDLVYFWIRCKLITSSMVLRLSTTALSVCMITDYPQRHRASLSNLWASYFLYLSTSTALAWVRFASCCLYVCPCFFQHDISEIHAARITKHDAQMSHDDSWKLIYFGVKRLKVKITNHKKHSVSLHSCEC